MPRPTGMTKRDWLREGWPDDAYFSIDYVGLEDDRLCWYFKRADFRMLRSAFRVLKNGGAMSDFRIEEHQQPFTVKAISHGYRVYAKDLDLAFMDIDTINTTLIHFFKEKGVELIPLKLHKLLNLKPKF